MSHSGVNALLPDGHYSTDGVMETTKSTQGTAKRMLDEKKEIQAYLKSKDESKRPKVKFAALIPLSACAGGKLER